MYNTLPHAPGLYRLNFPSGNFYIGMTVKSMRRRLWRHVAHANAGSQAPVARAIRKYGKENIEAVPLVICVDLDTLRVLEERAIKVFEAVTDGYNVNSKWNQTIDTTGYRHTEETRQKISDFQTGQQRSPETRARMEEGQTRVPVMAEGKFYPSINEAARCFGLNPGTVFYRLNTDKYEEWYRGA